MSQAAACFSCLIDATCSEQWNREWIRKQADRLDPLTPTEPSILEDRI